MGEAPMPRIKQTLPVPMIDLERERMKMETGLRWGWLRLLGILCLFGGWLFSGEPRYLNHVDLSFVLDRAGGRRVIKGVGDWEERRRAVMAGVEEVMGRVPEGVVKVAAELRVEEEDRVGKIIRRKVSYAVEEGVR